MKENNQNTDRKGKLKVKLNDQRIAHLFAYNSRTTTLSLSQHKILTKQAILQLLHLDGKNEET